MKNTPNDPVVMLQQLVRCPSVTPQEAGALDCVQGWLESAGFHCERLVFKDTDTPDVDNLFARIGNSGPHLCFAGHTDVVPQGDEAIWTHPPFAADISKGFLYGRGATDMKGSVAALRRQRSTTFARTAGPRARSRFSSPTTRKARPSTARRKCCSG